MLGVVGALLLTACSADLASTDSSSTTTAALGDPVDGECVTPASVGCVRPFNVDPEDYPFRSCAFDTDAGHIHYFDEGPRDADETILMVHGNPTWSFLYRNIATAMIEDGHRVVALDHLGMGMSDVPPTSEFDYRPRSHADNLEDLVIALICRTSPWSSRTGEAPSGSAWRHDSLCGSPIC